MQNRDGIFNYNRNFVPPEKKRVPPGCKWIRDISEIPNVKAFDPDKMVNNEFTIGNNGMAAKIPRYPDRITEKEDEDGTVWVQFIHDPVYDPEKNRKILRKTIIGMSLEALMRGMMQVTNRYHQFFDHNGAMIYKGEKPGVIRTEAGELEEIEIEDCPPKEPSERKSVAAAESTEEKPTEMKKVQPAAPEKSASAEMKTTKPTEAPRENPVKQKTAEPAESGKNKLTEPKITRPASRPAQKETQFMNRVFDIHQVKDNEVPIGGGQVAAKIPEIPGWISRRNNPEVNTTSIELVTERHYIPETRQFRKKRISIGMDAAPGYPGMMIPNENYYRYFDPEGNWILSENETDPELMDAIKKAEAARQEAKRKAAEEAERSKKQKMAEEEKQTQAQEQPRTLKSIVASHIQSAQQFDYLRMVFLDYDALVSSQVRKRPYVPMTLYQVVRINEILSELQLLFAGTTMARYLKLAEIPDNPMEYKDMPVTYGDMDVILKPYHRAINAFLYGSS